MWGTDTQLRNWGTDIKCQRVRFPAPSHKLRPQIKAITRAQSGPGKFRPAGGKTDKVKTMVKLSKRQIKKIAELHCAMHLAEVDIHMFDHHCNATDQEQELIISQIYKIAERLANNGPMNLGTTENIINFVKENYK